VPRRSRLCFYQSSKSENDLFCYNITVVVLWQATTNLLTIYSYLNQLFLSALLVYRTAGRSSIFSILSPFLKKNFIDAIIEASKRLLKKIIENLIFIDLKSRHKIAIFEKQIIGKIQFLFLAEAERTIHYVDITYPAKYRGREVSSCFDVL
jgi:hypothetical protein